MKANPNAIDILTTPPPINMFDGVPTLLLTGVALVVVLVVVIVVVLVVVILVVIVIGKLGKVMENDVFEGQVSKIDKNAQFSVIF